MPFILDRGVLTLFKPGWGDGKVVKAGYSDEPKLTVPGSIPGPSLTIYRLQMSANYTIIKPELKVGYPDDQKGVTLGPEGKVVIIHWGWLKGLQVEDGCRWVLVKPPKADGSVYSAWMQVRDYRPWGGSCWYDFWWGVGDKRVYVASNGCCCGGDCTMPYDGQNMIGNARGPWISENQK